MSRTYPPPKERAEPSGETVRLALEAREPDERLRLARVALAQKDLDRDTEFLLLRQVYVGHLERGEFGRAVMAARRMATVGILEDVAHHDAARALAARGDLPAAIDAQAQAVDAAPRDRKSFQLWSLGTLQHFAGDTLDSLASLSRAIRFADRDRPLIRAHLAWVRLEAGMAVPGLAQIVEALHRSPSREGYGRFLLGMIAHELGDARLASTHLRAFLKRNATIDRAKELTLREELRRARRALAHELG